MRRRVFGNLMVPEINYWLCYYDGGSTAMGAKIISKAQYETITTANDPYKHVVELGLVRGDLWYPTVNWFEVNREYAHFVDFPVGDVKLGDFVVYFEVSAAA